MNIFVTHRRSTRNLVCRIPPSRGTIAQRALLHRDASDGFFPTNTDVDLFGYDSTTVHLHNMYQSFFPLSSIRFNALNVVGTSARETYSRFSLWLSPSVRRLFSSSQQTAATSQCLSPQLLTILFWRILFNYRISLRPHTAKAVKSK